MVAVRCDDARLQLAASDELSSEERSGLEAHLSTCADCRQEKADIDRSIELVRAHAVGQPPPHLRAATLGAITLAKLEPELGLAVESPSSRLKASVMERVKEEQQGPAATENVIPMRSRRARMARGLGAAAALLILGVGVGWAVGAKDAPPGVAAVPKMPEGHETQTLDLEGMGPDALEVRHYRHDNFRLTLSVRGFAPTPSGFHYAVWVRGGSGDVAIGTFRLQREDDFEIPFALGVNPSDFPDLVVTVEPNDGDPTLEGEVVTEGTFDLDTVYHGTYDD